MPLTKAAVLQGAEGLAENKHDCERLEPRRSSSGAWKKEREGGRAGRGHACPSCDRCWCQNLALTSGQGGERGEIAVSGDRGTSPRLGSAQADLNPPHFRHVWKGPQLPSPLFGVTPR